MAVLGTLRGAMAVVIAALGVEIIQPRDLKAVLGIHQTLAWRIHRFVMGGNLLEDARQLPGRPGMSRFIAEAKARGVSASQLARVRESFDRYRALVRNRSGDRPTLEVVLANLDPENPTKGASGRSLRRNGFRSASAVWGSQTRLRLTCQIIGPSEDPDLLDFVLIRAFVGMRRLRRGARLPIAQLTVMDGHGRVPSRAAVQPLDQSQALSSLSIIPMFCSSPMPEIRIAKSPHGISEYQLGEVPLGDKDGATLVTAKFLRGVGSKRGTKQTPHGNTATSIRQPAEAAVIDVWVRKGLLPDVMPKGLLFSETCGFTPDEQLQNHAEILPMAERVERVGAGLPSAVLQGLPQYRDLMSYAFERAGWDPKDFVLFRLRQDYPMMTTALVMRFDLLPAPESAEVV